MTLSNSPEVLIAIPFYEGHNFVETIVESVAAQTYPNVRLLFVDNSPTRLRPSAIPSSLPRENVDIIQTPAGIGFGRAANVAQLRAMEEGIPYVLLLNQDATLRSDAIESAVKIARASKAAIVGGVEVHPETARIPQQYRDWYLQSYKTHEIESEDDLQLLTPAQTTQICGAAMLIDVAQAEAFGGFDPVFHMYGEDTELCQRLRNRGRELYVAPNFIYYHVHSHLNSSGLERRQIIVWNRQGRIVQEMKAHRMLGHKLARIAIRRGAEHLYDLLKYRDVKSLRLNLTSDISMIDRRAVLWRVHQQESPTTRAWRVARCDLSHGVR